MKHFLLTTSSLALIVVGSAALAQSNEAFLEQIGDENEASLTQTGLENVATVLQTGWNGRDFHVQTGDRNTYTSLHLGRTWQRDGDQVGNDNTITLNTNGAGSWIPLVTQTGNNNIASLDVTGDAYFSMNQQGDRNIFSVTAEGIDGNFQQNTVRGRISNDNIGTMTAVGDLHSAYFRILGDFNVGTISQTGFDQNGAQWFGLDYEAYAYSNTFTILQGGQLGYARQWLNGGDFNIATIDQSDVANASSSAKQTIEGSTNVALATQAGISSRSDSWQTGNLNDVNQTQTGDNHNGASRQTGNSNISVQAQLGSANIADLVQTGNINTATLTQNGSGNAATQSQVGDLNILLTTQLGATNAYEVVQTGLENNMTLSQIGVGHEAFATQTGNNNIGTQNQTGATHYASLIQTGNLNIATQIQN